MVGEPAETAELSREWKYPGHSLTNSDQRVAIDICRTHKRVEHGEVRPHSPPPRRVQSHPVLIDNRIQLR